MRLIDADALIEAIKNMSQRYCDCKDCDGRGQIIRVSEVIDIVKNEVPTAYSVDKVVEELEERKEEREKQYKRAIMEDGSYMLSKCFSEGARAYGKAIEIVKQGGVDDDVCEWEKGSSGYVGYPAYYSKCCTTNSNGLEMQTHIIADWKYCPYCGKNIKVVE